MSSSPKICIENKRKREPEAIVAYVEWRHTQGRTAEFTWAEVLERLAVLWRLHESCSCCRIAQVRVE
ncbi:hypothetical protein KDA_64940 [Dictyobacter alpinus]|uniref:Uncharacterized protein n=1 Tax=Dictyobacter alpinus TaxID=2014873 RepID=A0A402BI60_9CHLR|nr:hypothetical protein KDA_64940 [Dictyobacter alpinus]